MDIITCIKQVPDTSKVDVLKIDASRKDIEKDGLAFKINEWDEYVLETASRLKKKLKGVFSTITAGPEGCQGRLDYPYARPTLRQYLRRLHRPLARNS